MKTREISLEEKYGIMKLRKEGKSVRAVEQALAFTTILNILKKKETAGVLSNRHRTGRPRKTTVDDRNIVRAVKKNPKRSVSDITNNLNQSFLEDLYSSNIEAVPKDANHPAVRIRRRDYNLKRSTKLSHKSSGKLFYGLIRPTLTATKVMGRPKCEEWRHTYSKTYMLVCETWWRMCHGLGLHGSFWSGLTNLYRWCNSAGSSRMNSEVNKYTEQKYKCNTFVFAPIFHEMNSKI